MRGMVFGGMVYRENGVGDLRAAGFGVVRMGVDEVLAEAVRLTNYADDARLSGEGGGGSGGGW
jgi:hypothetical protein